jgi:hypothetical protein
MNKYKSMIAVGLWLLLSLNANAAGLKDAAEIRAFTDQIMAQVGSNDLGAAFDLIERHSVVEAAAVEAMSVKAVEQRELLSKRIGAPIGSSFIGMKAAGDSLLRMQYLEKTPKHALLWTFYFYQTPEGWLLSTWSRDEQYEQLFMLG